MVSPELVVMAAGMGSRYGGLKQLDPVGPRGEYLIDYSVFDAARAGFGRVVFVIRKEIEELFRDRIGRRIERRIDAAYVIQSADAVPAGFALPPGRRKPWGTGHAVLCCAAVVRAPFATINADDFYGASTFQSLFGFLREAGGIAGRYCMVGYRIENTLTEHGTVARGICSVDGTGRLTELVERSGIRASGDAAEYTEDGTSWHGIPRGSLASMNAWGFSPDVFDRLEAGFSSFLAQAGEDSLRAEYALPSAVGRLVSTGEARVAVIPSAERWYGMTYGEDAPTVREAIRGMVQRGTYPESLWGG